MKSVSYIQMFLLLILFSVNTFSQQQNVTISFTDMTPHVSQELSIRVIDKSTLKETGRTTMMVSSAAFDVTLQAVEVGGSYFIDFFADLNMNGSYDAPPADHAWRLELNDAQGDDTLPFVHNTTFTDIKWPYLLTVNFESMTPHIGQKLELKVENSTLEKEVGRVKIDTINSAAFSVQVPGLIEPGDYSVEFYADLNGNGLYDAPPTDHAWKLSFNFVTGDQELTFMHNTSFTDIDWKYLFTMNFISMTPHLGQLFQLRVVSSDNEEEVGRISMNISVADFTVYIPGIDIDKDYNIDFFSDHNNNGVYDAPPADHAWRETFTAEGDYTTDFTHNTSFTDIQWPELTAAEDIPGTPVDYTLYQNYPNPFNPSTEIKFSLPLTGIVTLKVYDVIGNEVAVLLNEEKQAGSYNINWNAAGLSSGVYYYRLKSGSFEQTRKMILMK